ncbi:MAG: STAS domain-containing protein [Candidatus Xenobium sp.]|jgi:anti-anti-sigma factor|nr:STAS domain-containing protein [Burkholderiales bacterium]
MGCGFRIEIRRQEGRRTLYVKGDLDLASAEALERILQDSQGSPGLVVDVRGVGCADSSGIRVLLEGARRMQDQGFELRIVGASPRVARAFQVLGLENHLDPHPTAPFPKVPTRYRGRRTRQSRRPLPDS